MSKCKKKKKKKKNLPNFLFAFKGVLEFIESLLELDLDFGKMVDLVLGSLELLSGLLVDLALVLLFFVELVDELILVSNLVIEVADLVVFGSLILLGLLDRQFQILDVLLQAGDFLFQLLLSLEEVVSRLLFLLESVSDVLKKGKNSLVNQGSPVIKVSLEVHIAGLDQTQKRLFDQQ